MSPTRTAAILVALALAPVVASGCRDAEQERAAAARAREWTLLRASRQQLDAERGELARLRGRLAAAPVDAEGAPIEAADARLAADVERRATLLRARSAELGERLVRLLAALPLDEEAATPSPQRAAAIRLKSDEDLAVAQEWVERGGDYRRAIEILETQRRLDPGYPRLEQALARARDMRFVTAERMARVQPGMSPVEVRAALGPVNLREVLRRPAERLEAWYYPKSAGGRAAVYFRYDADRRGYVVYQTDAAAGSRQPAAAGVVG